MSYLGFTRCISRYYLSQINFPKILEIGIDRGQTTIPLIQNLCTSKPTFMYAGIDILLRNDLCEQISQFEGVTVSWLDDLDDRAVMMFEENSLDWLKSNQNADIEFDLVLVDGDHNYHTVFNELKLIEHLIKPTTLIVCDDYQGRYSEKDMFYSEREEYKDVEGATQRVDSQKQGVRNAVIDYTNQSKLGWRVDRFGPSEPCFLYQPEFLKVNAKPASYVQLRDMEADFIFNPEKKL